MSTHFFGSDTVEMPPELLALIFDWEATIGAAREIARLSALLDRRQEQTQGPLCFSSLHAVIRHVSVCLSVDAGR